MRQRTSALFKLGSAGEDPMTPQFASKLRFEITHFLYDDEGWAVGEIRLK